MNIMLINHFCLVNVLLSGGFVHRSPIFLII